MNKNGAVILAGGKGTRMKSELPKVMCEVLGRPMIDYVIDACTAADCDLCVIVGYKAEVLRTIDLDKIEMIGYGFQIEMKYTAWRHGFRLREESIVFTDRELGTSKMSSSIFGEAFFGVMKLPFRRL